MHHVIELSLSVQTDIDIKCNSTNAAINSGLQMNPISVHKVKGMCLHRPRSCVAPECFGVAVKQ